MEFSVRVDAQGWKTRLSAPAAEAYRQICVVGSETIAFETVKTRSAPAKVPDLGKLEYQTFF